MKRYITTISLLLILIGPSMLTILYLQYQQSQIRHEVKRKMKAGIPKNQLTLLKFAHAEINEKLDWKHSKEFSFNGQMYDVIEKEITADSSYYWCWWDHKETALNQQLDELVMLALQQNPQQKSQGKLLFHFFKTNYLATEQLIVAISFSATAVHHTPYLWPHAPVYMAPKNPPPIHT